MSSHSVRTPEVSESFEYQTIFTANKYAEIVKAAKGETLNTEHLRSYAYTSETFNKFFEEMVELLCAKKPLAYSSTDYGTYFILESPDCLLTIGVQNQNAAKDLYTITYHYLAADDSVLANHISNLWSKYIAPLPNPDDKFQEGSVYLLSKTQTGYKLTNIGQVPLEFKEHHYAPEVVKGFRFVQDQIVKDNPRGRLAILEGPPGTGKTSLLRSMFTEIDKAVFINFPAMFLTSLEDPALISFFASAREQYLGPGEKFVLVLEDADACLVPREQGNMSLISTLLNACDGIIGSITDLRIIATTNAESTQFDAAITRPGRLITKVKVGKLSPEQSEYCYEKITGKVIEFDEEKSLAEIYQIVNFTEEEIALYGKSTKKRRNPIGFGS